MTVSAAYLFLRVHLDRDERADWGRGWNFLLVAGILDERLRFSVGLLIAVCLHDDYLVRETTFI